MKAINQCMQWLVCVGLLLMALDGQAQITSSLPRDQYGAIIAPDPTPEQRELGKQLLEKILEVVLTIPLSEPEKVIRALGFEDSSKSVNLTNEFNLSKGNAQGVAAQGLTSASITKLTKTTDSIRAPYIFSTSINFGQVCIHVEDVMVRIKPVAKKVSMGYSVYTSPYPFAPKQKVDVLSFSEIANASVLVNAIIFGFDYQYCANRITVNYKPTTQGEQP